jgi:hypothetical protein
MNENTAFSNIKIADSILEKTKKCEREFCCLSENDFCLCEVLDSTKLATVKIKPKPHLSCSYCLSVGTLRFCLCPTRNAIYKQYKK